MRAIKHRAEARSDLFSKKIPLETAVMADRTGIVAIQAMNEDGLERELRVQIARLLTTGGVF